MGGWCQEKFGVFLGFLEFGSGSGFWGQERGWRGTGIPAGVALRLAKTKTGSPIQGSAAGGVLTQAAGLGWD